MKGKRDSLRVWLEKNLNANNIRGLEWKDRKNKIFKIRWKHASKHGWSSELDGCVFREWAIYSGKFKPGETPQEQPKVWKANFRCALNALPDIQEVVSERETRGNEAQKVFHMRPHVLKQGRRNRASSRVRDVPGYHDQGKANYLHFYTFNFLHAELFSKLVFSKEYFPLNVFLLYMYIIKMQACTYNTPETLFKPCFSC